MKEDDLLKLCKKFNKSDTKEEKVHKHVLLSHCNFKEKRMERYKVISMRLFMERMLFEYESIA